MRSFLGRLAIACLAVVLITGGAVVIGNAYEQHEYAKSRTVYISNGILTPVKAGKPANFLLIGSDSRQGETAAQAQHFGAADVGGGSDVMMVLHVEPQTRTGFLVSFPRDLVVSIPGHGTQLLNATYTIGGPNLVLQTIEQDFGIQINHYIEVGFTGFRDIVNAIGRIRLWFPTPVHDPYTGLDVEHSGCQALNGDQALAYARSRHYYVPDNLLHPAPWHWTYPPAGSSGSGYGGDGWTQGTGEDLDRIPRQQYFLRTLSQAAVDKTGNSPLGIPGLLNALFKNFAHDQHLSVHELNQLALTFYGLNPAQVQMVTLPNEPGTGQWSQHVIEKLPDANLVLARLKNAVIPAVKLPIPLPQTEVTVRVVNGSGIKGLAAKALAQFTSAGFNSAGPPEDASRDDFVQTQIRNAPNKGLEGYTVGLASGTANVVTALTRKDTLDADVLVIVGRDWNRLPHNFDYAVFKARTTTTTRPKGSASTHRPTTTTIPVTVDTRFVPVNRKTGGPLVGCQP
jgi:LCP family protein required for cell wall assembly